MKYLSILCLMAAIAAFSTDASATVCECKDNNKVNDCNTALKNLLNEGKLPSACADQAATKEACLTTLQHNNLAGACISCSNNFDCEDRQGNPGQ